MSVLQRYLAAKDSAGFDLVLPGGKLRAFRNGHGSDAKPVFSVDVRTKRGLRALISVDEYTIAEAYVNADIDVEGDFLECFGLRRLFSDKHPLLWLMRFLQPRMNGRNRADKASIAAHYDLGNEFYWSFLDQRHRLYSQALYRSDDESLEDAVENKLNYICEICQLVPGSRVLDVGAGWGAFSRFAASRGIDVTMLTLSKEQFSYLASLAADPACSGRLTPRLESIFEFDTSQRFDAIVGLGVMEHLPDYRRVLERLDMLLRPGGYVYMDFVATRKKYAISTFTHQHVFQGDHTPVYMPGLIATSNELPFEIIAIHNDRHSYFLTAKAWAQRLEAAREQVVRTFGEKAFRSFRLYLWAVANCLYRDGDLESYRVVLKKSMGLPSYETAPRA